MKYIYLSTLLLLAGFSSFATGAISGSLSVCAGSTTTLTDTTAGGTWYSLNTAVATVNPSTGVVSGVSAGTATISYDLGLGGADTIVVTVNAMPNAITGTTTVCAAGTDTLSATPSGGRWGLSPTSVATINDTSGVVSGIVSGTAIASYTLTGGCYVTTPITVSPVPGAITGAGTICIGSTTILSDATTGGTWSSSNAGTAYVDPTGDVLGSSAGFATIAYTTPAGCSVSFLMNVISSPAPIAGLPAGALCTGGAITFADATTGGYWSSGDTTIAKVDSTTGVITAVAPGFNVISYSLSALCSVSTIITVDPAPTAILNDSAVICTSSPLFLADTTNGGKWSGSSAVATVDSATGLVTGLTAGTATLTYTLPGGCAVTATVTVDVAPCNTGVAATNVINTTPVLFPNPATDELTIETAAGNYASFTITNGIGQTFAQQQITAKQTIVNVKDLAPAIYYITFKGDNGTLVQRFIKL
jgi:uncharacterized protein YjdB